MSNLAETFDRIKCRERDREISAYRDLVRQHDKRRDLERIKQLESKLYSQKPTSRAQAVCLGAYENFDKGCKLYACHSSGKCKACR